MDAPEDVERSAAPPAYHSGALRTPMSLSLRSLPWLALALLGAACGAPSVPPGAPPPAPSATPRGDSLAGPWTLRPSRRERAHTIEISGTLAARVDTFGAADRIDTLRARVRAVSSRVVSGDGERFAGLLQGYELSSGDSVPFASPAGLFVPLPFAAIVGERGAAPALEVPASGACSVAAAALQPLRDLWLGAPTRLARDQEWADSTTVAICRDSIPLTTRTVRRFKVTGAEVLDGELVLRVVRESRTTITGEGAQFGESLRIDADGTGRLEVLISLAGGEVVRGEGESALAMRMTGRHRVQLLHQAMRTTITSP
jgi:hypothetical protein